MAIKRIGREPSPTDLGYKLIDAQIKRLIALRELADTDEFRGVANAIAATDAYEAANPRINTGDNPSWAFSTYPSGLQDWRDEKLVMLVTALTALDPDSIEPRDYPDSNNKDWTFEWKFEDGYSIRVHVYAYLSANAPGACRRIQIGTKMVEQPIYRNECAPVFEDHDKLPPPVIAIDLEAL